MTNITYTKTETALLFAGRSQVVNNVIGDLFAGIDPYTTSTEYNGMVDKYLLMESDISALVAYNLANSTNYTVTGKDVNGTNVSIDDDPAHARPIHK